MIAGPMIRPDKVAIYVRWSTEEQTDGTTLQVQLEACQAFLVSQGWTPNPQLTFVDDGYSGGTLDRPAMKTLRKACGQNSVDCVVVFKIDRLSRSVLDTVNLVLNEWGDKVYLKSAREPIDTTTAMGKQFFYMLISYAEWERNVIRERTMSGRLKRAQQGRHVFKPPFGYALGDQKGDRVVVTEEASLVLQIYDRYLGGMGDRQISSWLNQQGYRTKQGKLWHPNMVKNLLTNPIYAGTLQFGRTPPGGQAPRKRPGVNDPYLVTATSAAPSIIRPEVFEAVQALRRQQAGKVAGRAVSSPHLLTGLLRCRCGAGLQFKQIHNKSADNNGKKFGYYVCCEKYSRGNIGCKSGFIPSHELDHLAVKQFMGLYGDRQSRAAKLDQMLQATARAAGTNYEDRLRQFQQEADTLTASMVRLDVDYLSGNLPAKRYDQLRAQVEERLTDISGEVNALKILRDQEVAVSARRDALLLRLGDIDHWNELDIVEQKKLLRTFIESIVVFRPMRSPNWACEITWRIGNEALP